eukprot:jgi/Mesen1/1862/ME000143S00913
MMSLSSFKVAAKPRAVVPLQQQQQRRRH